MSSVENNAKVYGHVLEILDAQLTLAKRDVDWCEREGWVEALADAKQKWDHWALLYDAVADGLLENLAAESEKYKAMAGMAVAS
jgi:hypothetical protein